MDKQILENLVAEGSSIRDIASQTGKSFSTVRYWLKKHDLKTEASHANAVNRVNRVKTRECVHCKTQFEMNISEIANHTRWCEENPLRETYSKELSKARACITDKGSKANQYTYGAVCSETTKEKLRVYWKSDENRERMSKKIRSYLDVNPESVGWRHHGAWKVKESYPEKYFREVFESHGLKGQFAQEYSIKRFSIDFAFPDIQVAVEIDGSQHRLPENIERDKRRDEELAELGWETIRVDWKRFKKSSPESKQKVIDNLLKRVNERPL